MQGWYAFDEGGNSGVGGWNHVRTRWPQGKTSVAMPHGWAIAEFHLLLRDSLLFEDGNKLVLFGGVPPDWFRNSEGMRAENLPTHFGKCSFEYAPAAAGAVLLLTGNAEPPDGFVLRLPTMLRTKVTGDGKIIGRSANGDVLLPSKTRRIALTFEAGN